MGECSPVYRSEPQDVRDQPWFANQVVRLYCSSEWTAQGLLRALLNIESAMGRVRSQDKGPRLIDLDLLLFNEQCLNSPELTLPHPRMTDRAFVLIPLQDIAPGLVFPGGRTLAGALKAISCRVQGDTIIQPASSKPMHEER